jgi:uncharacterized protein (TIRG00374 family)
LQAILYLGLLAVLLIYISSLKWQYFLEALGSHVSVFHLFRLYMVGYFINLVVPSYVGGDAVRSWYAGKKVGQHEAATATILERYTGFVAMVVLALSFVWFVDLVTIEIKLAVVGIALGLIAITLLALSPGLLNQFDKISQLRPIIKHVKKIQAGFHLARKDKRLLVKAMALSFVFHTATVVNTMAAAYAVGWYNPPMQDMFVVLPLILLIGALPIAPSGLGIQEGAFYFFLTGLGATPGQALGVGVVLRAKGYTVALIGGLVWYFVKRAEAKGIQPEPLSDTV